MRQPGVACSPSARQPSSWALDLGKATVAVQGYGNAGQFAHQLMTSMFGSKVVAVSDSKGGAYCTDGLDFDKTLEWKNQEGTVATYQCCEETKRVTNEELLELDVDILIPAAWRIRSKKRTLAYQSQDRWPNWPTVPPPPKRRDSIQEGRVCDPDFLCNAGGVTVSYFEQVQNAYDYYWTVEDVYERLDRK